MTVHVCAKVLLHVWSNDFMTQHYPLNNRTSCDKMIFRLNKYELSELCCMQTCLADLKVGASGSDKSGF